MSKRKAEEPVVPTKRIRRDLHDLERGMEEGVGVYDAEVGRRKASIRDLEVRLTTEKCDLRDYQAGNIFGQTLRDMKGIRAKLDLIDRIFDGEEFVSNSEELFCDCPMIAKTPLDDLDCRIHTLSQLVVDTIYVPATLQDVAFRGDADSYNMTVLDDSDHDYLSVTVRGRELEVGKDIQEVDYDVFGIGGVREYMCELPHEVESGDHSDSKTLTFEGHLHILTRKV